VVIFHLVAAAVLAFSITFFPLLSQHVDIASASAEEFANAVIGNTYVQVERAMSTCARGFEGLDSAGIQDLYRVESPAVNKYWELRARLAGDLMLWLAFDDGSGVFVARNVPCDAAVVRTPNASLVWVTELHANGTYHAERWHMEGINTSVVAATRVGPRPTNFSPLVTAWYQDYVNSIYAHWRSPEVDTLGEYTAMRIGAQGGLNTSARYCVYMAEVNSDALTALLMAIQVSASGTMIVVHSASKALLGANFAFQSVVNESGVLRPRLFTEIGGESWLMADVVQRFEGAISDCEDACVLDAGVSFDKLFVRVRRLVNQEYGLDVRLVIAMEAMDFLSSVRSSRADALQSTIPLLIGVGIGLILVLWLSMVHTSTLYFFPSTTPTSTPASTSVGIATTECVLPSTPHGGGDDAVPERSSIDELCSGSTNKALPAACRVVKVNDGDLLRNTGGKKNQ
jgi:hypothetical protein